MSDMLKRCMWSFSGHSHHHWQHWHRSWCHPNFNTLWRFHGLFPIHSSWRGSTGKKNAPFFFFFLADFDYFLHPAFFFFFLSCAIQHKTTSLMTVMCVTDFVVTEQFFSWWLNSRMRSSAAVDLCELCCSSPRKLWSMIHGDPRAYWPWSMFSSACGLEAFLEALNDRVAQPKPSLDFSSGNPFSEPFWSPPTIRCIQSMSWSRDSAKHWKVLVRSTGSAIFFFPLA